MFNAGIPEKAIQDRSGYRSLDGSVCLHLLDLSDSDTKTPDGHTSYDQTLSMQVSAPKVSCSQQQQFQPNLTFESA